MVKTITLFHIPKCGGMSFRHTFRGYLKGNGHSHFHHTTNFTVALLRDPVERFLSAFDFISRLSYKERHKWIDDPVEWAKMGRGFASDNMIIRFLAPCDLGRYVENSRVVTWDYDKDPEPVTWEDVDRAEENLKRINKVILLENLDKGMKELAEELNVNIEVKRYNEGERSVYSRYVLNYIEALNHKDRALYERVKQCM